MATPEVIGIVIASFVGIAGIVCTIYYARKSRKVKLLAYQTSSPVALATAFSPEDDYKLAVTYKRKGFKEERFESIFTRFLRFANVGREPIRREDITRLNPIRIKIEEVRTLDISIARVTRPVNNVAIANRSLSDNSASADITFDYLDYRDGGLIKILTVGGGGTVTILGDIIGMPDGIMNIDEVGSKGALGKAGPWFATLFVLAALVASVFSFYWVTGSWNNAWLLALPFAALIITLLIVIVVYALWPSGKPSFPKSLNLPDWFYSLHFLRYRSDIELPLGYRRETLEGKKRLLEEDIKSLEEESTQKKEMIRWKKDSK